VRKSDTQANFRPRHSRSARYTVHRQDFKADDMWRWDYVYDAGVKVRE
jgi:hypothetical protein